MENGKSPLRNASATPPRTLWYVVSLSLFHDFIFASLPLSHLCTVPPPFTLSRRRLDAVMPLTDHWPHRPRTTSSLSFFLSFSSLFSLSFFLSFSSFFSFSSSLVLPFFLSLILSLIFCFSTAIQ